MEQRSKKVEMASLEADLRIIMDRKIKKFLELEDEFEREVAKLRTIIRHEQYKTIRDLKQFAALLMEKYPIEVVSKINKVWENQD